MNTILVLILIAAISSLKILVLALLVATGFVKIQIFSPKKVKPEKQCRRSSNMSIAHLATNAAVPLTLMTAAAATEVDRHESLANNKSGASTIPLHDATHSTKIETENMPPSLCGTYRREESRRGLFFSGRGEFGQGRGRGRGQERGRLGSRRSLHPQDKPLLAKE